MSRILLVVFFVVAGLGHFVMPANYLQIMPPAIPCPAAMVAISGAAEILGGIAVCFSATRRAAGWSLVALLVAVFPANLHALSAGMSITGHNVPAWMLWARLPFQLLFILWVYRACLRKSSKVDRS